MGVKNQDLIEALVRGAPDGYVFDGDLEIAHRPDLRRLPAGLTVRSLHIEDCPALEELPDGLTVTWHAQVRSCPAVRRIGRGVRIGHDLDVSDCAAIDELPDDLQVGWTLRVGPRVRSLRAGLAVGCLDLRAASAIRAVPARLRARTALLPAHVEEIGDDVALDGLEAQEGSLIAVVPRSARIGSFLELPGAQRLEALPPLRDMFRVTLTGSGLRSVAEIHAASWIDLTGCQALAVVTGPVRTRTLSLSGCARLERLERAEVDALEAQGCSALRRIPASVRVAVFADLFGCTALEAIDLEAPPSGLVLLASAAQLDLLRPAVRAHAAVPVPGRGAELGEPVILPVNAERLAFSPSSSLLATVSREEATVWDLSGKRVATIATTTPLRCVAMAPDGARVALGGGFHDAPSFCLWDLRSGELSPLEGLSDPPLIEVSRVGFSPDGRLVAGSDQSGRVLVVDVATQIVVEKREDRGWPFGNPRWSPQSTLLPAARAACLHDGREVLVLHGRVLLVDPSCERPHVFAPVSAAGPVKVAVADRAGVLAACAPDGMIRLFALPSLAPLAEGRALPGADRIAVAEDGSAVAVTTPDDVRIYRR